MHEDSQISYSLREIHDGESTDSGEDAEYRLFYPPDIIANNRDSGEKNHVMW